ncbi:hypothetical protein BDR03DRAFT_194105 [Suillus americanus]|nr:hypothetical protein BDR03DRAFT_194105 [Suillus americanus]
MGCIAGVMSSQAYLFSMRVNRCACDLTYENVRGAGKLRYDVYKMISLLVLENLQEVSAKILNIAQHRFTSRKNERDGLVAEMVDVCFGVKRVAQI